MSMSAQLGEKWAVLIGIDCYLEGNTERLDTNRNPIQYENLEGCVEDILQVEQYLLQTMKVEKSHIVKLLAPRPGHDPVSEPHDAMEDTPTYSNIVHALRSITERANTGDLVYIHYSGHGGRATTVFPEFKGEADFDEALVPTDITRGGQYLRDLEMAYFLKEMVEKGLVVTVVLDCCHSGSGTRGSGRARVRGIAKVYQSVLPRDFPASLGGTAESLPIAKSWLLEPRGYTLFAACRPHEQAREDYWEEGRMQGVLTYWLLNTLRHSPGSNISSRMLYRRVCARIRNQYPDQTPMLAGESDRFFFGADVIPPVHTIVVRKVKPKLTNGEQLEKGDELELAGGRLHGVREGSQYAVFPFTASSSGPGGMGPNLATIEVKDVLQLMSIATLLELNDTDGRKVEPGCQAVLLELPREAKFSVRFSSPEAAAAEEFRRNWENIAGHKTWLHLLSGEDTRSPSFLIAVNDRKEYKIQEIQKSSGEPMPSIALPLSPLSVGEGASMQKLIGRLRHLAQFRMVQGLENPDGTSTLRGKFLFEVLGRIKHSESSLECERLQEDRGVFDVNDGESLQLHFKNEAEAPVNFALFDLQPLFGITQLYPEMADFECLGPGEERLIEIDMSIPSRYAATTVSIMDTLKVFVTLEPTSFRTLELPDIDDAELKGFRGDTRSTNMLEDLLERLIHPQRHAKLRSLAINQWQTMDMHIRTSGNPVKGSPQSSDLVEAEPAGFASDSESSSHTGEKRSPMLQVRDAMNTLNEDQGTVTVDIRWDLLEFIENGLTGPEDLETVLVVTGAPDKAYASSCMDYARIFWGIEGTALVRDLIKRASSVNGSKSETEGSLGKRDEKKRYKQTGVLSATNTHTTFEFFDDKKKAKVKLSALTKERMIQICQQLSWLAAVCRLPEEGTIRASEVVFKQRGRGNFELYTKPLSRLPSGDGCCWHGMFQGYVLAHGFPVPEREHALGVELPFDIMAILAMTFHPVNYGEGIVLKGSHTALVPKAIGGSKNLEAVREVQWHFIGKKPELVEIHPPHNEPKLADEYSFGNRTIVADNLPLSWEVINKYCQNILAAGSYKALAKKRTFVGSFPLARNYLGTKESGYDTIQRSEAPDEPKGTTVELERAVALAMSSNFATGGAFSMSASTKITFPKYDPTAVLRQTFFGDKLRLSKHKPLLLYDVDTKSAWMVPETSVVLHLMLAWACKQEELEGGPVQKVLDFMPFVEASRDGGNAASLAIRRYALKPLPDSILRSNKLEKTVRVGDIAFQMFMALDTLKEQAKLLRGKILEWGTYLRGFEFADVLSVDEVTAKRVTIDKARCGGWIKLVEQRPEMVILFCKHLGEPLRHETGQRICRFWTTTPKNFNLLTADSACLRYLSEKSGKSEHLRVTKTLFLAEGSGPYKRHDGEDCRENDWPCCNPPLEIKSRPPKTVLVLRDARAVIIGKAVPRLLKSKALNEIPDTNGAAQGEARSSRNVVEVDLDGI